MRLLGVLLLVLGVSTRTAVESFSVSLPSLRSTNAATRHGTIQPQQVRRPTRSNVVIAASSSSSTDAPSVPTEWQGQVLNALKDVIDPDLERDLVSLGLIKNLTLLDNSDDNGDGSKQQTVSFDVELATPALAANPEDFRQDCQERVQTALDWTDTVKVGTVAPEATPASTQNVVGLSNVGAVIAVSSCKGGVGKSTTAVNLAFSLQQRGASVGILDADIYGPSLPTMVTPDDELVRFVERQISPLERNGVKLMSFGFVNDGSAIMRGPIVTQLLDQILSVTHWGELDYLILDMPPGTGDIQLTLTQRLNITAAVIVTTPQELSFVDVERGVEMFDEVNVPCVAVVENMAFLEVEKTPTMDEGNVKEALMAKLQQQADDSSNDNDSSTESLAQELLDIVQARQTPVKEQVRIFGPGHKQRLSKQWGIEHTFSMPLMNDIAAQGDAGTPYVLANPDSTAASTYRDLAAAVANEVSLARYRKVRPEIVFDETNHRIVVDQDEAITPADLRRACRCAMCVEELTGRQILEPTSVRETIRPLEMKPTGNYALSVDWSDGHKSLYPYRQIKALLEEQKQQGGVTDAASQDGGSVATESDSDSVEVVGGGGVRTVAQANRQGP